nr:hypothetical protein [Tanacetum cinerariifolium]
MTPEAVQTMIDQALLRNSGGGDGSHSSLAENRRNMHTARPCYYADFMKCHPLNFKGTEGALATLILLIIEAAMGQTPGEMVVLSVEIYDISREIVLS